MLTFFAAKFALDLELPANLLTSCSSHLTTFYTEFYGETFPFGFEESEATKVAWVKIKKKTGAKEDEKGQSLTVQRKHENLQLAASGKGLWYNQPVAAFNSSSSKDIGMSRMKITASEAEKFIDEPPDSGDSNTSASPS